MARPGKSRCWRPLLLACLLLMPALAVPAQVTTERGSSILIFPRVLADPDGLQTGGFPVETIVQVTNTSNSLAFAHCFYVNSAPIDPTRPVGVLNPPLWQEVDFDIVLTKQQPTVWVAGMGRGVDPTDPQCSRIPLRSQCYGAGFDPGRIPAVPPGFVGHLMCVEVDSSGAPLNGNRLKGEATLVTPSGVATATAQMRMGEASKYNAIGIPGLNTDTNANDGDFVLCLGGGPRPGCPGGAEYAGCPETLVIDHLAEGASHPAAAQLRSAEALVRSEWTLLPCTQDLENQIPASVVAQFKVVNEFEEMFSASTTVECWRNLRLGDVSPIFSLRFLGTRFAQTRITPGGVDASGLLGVMETFVSTSAETPPFVSRAAFNVHVEGQRAFGDRIGLPEVLP